MNSQYPIIKIESVPNIYLYKKADDEIITNIEDVFDKEPEDIDYSYSNLMCKFSKIAPHAKKKKK